MDNAQIDELFNRMQKLPRAQQVLWVVPQSTPKRTIRYDINFFFTAFSNISNNQRVIPSFALMQTFLNVKLGPDAIEMNPVLGFSAQGDFQDENKRDYALHHPAVSLPEEADERPAPWYDWGYHEFQHAYTSSWASKNFRRLFIKVANVASSFLLAQSKLSLQVKKALSAFEDSLLDMGISRFRAYKEDGSLEGLDYFNRRFCKDLTFSDNDLFWLEIHSRTVKLMYLETDLNVQLFERIVKQLLPEPALQEGPLRVYKMLHDASFEFGILHLSWQAKGDLSKNREPITSENLTCRRIEMQYSRL